MKYPKIISLSLTGRFFLSGISRPDNLLIIGTAVYQQNHIEKEGSLLLSAERLSYYASDGHLTPENRDQINLYELDNEEVKNLLEESNGSAMH